MKSLMPLIFFSQVFLVVGQGFESVSIEASIKSLIFQNKSYDKTLRPNYKTEISLCFYLKQLVSVDEKAQSITTSSYLFVSWEDKRLDWSSSQFNSTNKIPILATNLWIPDLFVVNSMDANAALQTYINNNIAWIDYVGNVVITVTLNALKTRCKMDPSKFPYDTQTCSIRIGSWQHDISRIELDIYNLNFNETNNFTPNPVWDIIKITNSSDNTNSRMPFTAPMKYTENEIMNEDMVFSIEIRRIQLYYMINNIYPSLVLNIISLLAFFLPFATQVGLSMSIFLTLAIYALRVSSDMPVESRMFPMISVYYFLSILYTLIALVWFLIANKISNANSLPKFLIDFGCTFKKLLAKKRVDLVTNLENIQEQIQSNINSTNNIEVQPPLLKRCNQCEMCKKCKEMKEKEETKKKTKKKIEAFVSFLNWIVFTLLATAVFISNLFIWLSVAN